MKTTNKALESLLNAGKQKEQEIKQIPSVAPQKEIELNRPQPKEKETFGKEDIKTKEINTDGIDYFFSNVSGKMIEGVRITPELHKQLKLLATCAGSKIGTIINNIVAKELAAKSKDIQRYIKKNI